MENITFDMLTNWGSFAALIFVLRWMLTKFSKQMDEHKEILFGLKESIDSFKDFAASTKALNEKLIEKLLNNK